MAQRPTVIRNIDGVTRIVPKKTTRQRLNRIIKNNKRAAVVGSLLLVASIGVLIIVGVHALKKPNYDDLTTVTNALSKHMVLPKGETPLLATVTDKSALKTPFLKEADNGDRIIVYNEAKRVIIYRPSLDRIIDIGPVVLDNIPKTQ